MHRLKTGAGATLLRNMWVFDLRETRALQRNRKIKIFHMRAPQAQGKIGLRAMRELRISAFLWELCGRTVFAL